MSGGEMGVYTTVIILGIVALLTVSLGTLVFMQATNNRVNQLFMVMSYAMAFWVGTNIVYMLSNSDMQFIAALLSYGAAAWLTISFVTFCNSIVPQQLDKESMQIITLATVLLGCASVMPGFIATGVEDGEIQTQLIPLLIYGASIVAGLFIGNWLLVYAARTAPKNQRNQYRFLVMGLIVGAVIGVVCNLILPATGNYNFAAYGPLGLLVFLGMCVYSIAKHGLFDVRFASLRAAGYVASLCSIAGVYFGVAYFLSEVFLVREKQSGSLAAPINIAIALLLAVLFQPIKNFFNKATDRYFYRSQYDTDEFISELGDALTSTSNMRSMLARAAEVIHVTLRSSGVSFLTRKERSGYSIVTVGRKCSLSRDELEEIGELAELSDDAVIDVIDADTNYQSRALHRLRRSGYSFILPLGKQLGFVLVRERLGGAYSERDKRVLAAVSDELTIAIQNARSVEGLRELNVTLQQRIDEATKELRQSNRELKKLDQVKDEFVSMASHQLRTPLTSIKGYISMVLEGDAGKITPQQEKLLSEAFTSSERMVRLIGDFLNVSRLQTGKFMIDAKPTDFGRVVTEEIESIRNLARSHGQDIIFDAPKQAFHVVIDEDKTRQVIMNFIDNAIYYSPDTDSITIKLYQSKKHVVFEVHDRGIGVPKDKQQQLFTKFFRADNARIQRPDGTGIGLYLAKKVVEAQGGEIVFHSQPGLGSVFGFKLPLDPKN